jgi:hypothetical protein
MKNIALTVVEGFLSYSKGDVITDPKLIKHYLVSEWQNHFIKTDAPADPAPE